ncbi:MAG: phage tail protein [Planctomycetota bacterium]|jgi:hypothetical protein
MSKASPIITNFTSGELSPRLDGRIDLAKYFNGAKKLFNMIVYPHGGTTRRPGTQFIQSTTDGDYKSRLIPFEFSDTQSYILEFGYNAATGITGRVYKDQGYVNTATGVYDFEISPAINEASLPYLTWAQTADTLYMVSSQGDMPPCSLTRTDHDAWTFSQLTLTSDPFGGASGYPKSVGFFEQRSLFAGTPTYPQRIWMSKTDDYTDFGGGTGDADGIDITLAADDVNPILWLRTHKGLLLGTLGGEWRISSESYTEPISPSNIFAQRESKYGSEPNVQPIQIGPAIIFCQRHGRKLRELVYNFEIDGYQAGQLTLLAEHLTNPATNGASIVELVFQDEPDSILWARRADGTILGSTYIREQDVIAFHQHELGNDDNAASVESMAVIPGGNRDELWMLVRRALPNGATRFIELMADPDWNSASDCWYVEAGLKYDGNGATTITGLEHLNGASVSIQADGYAVADSTVNAGSVVITNEASKVTVGLPNQSYVQTMRLEGGSEEGTSQGKLKRLAAVIVRVLNTGPFEMGVGGVDYDDVPVRASGDPMGTAVPLFTGDREVRGVPYQNWDRPAYVWVRQTLPLPMTITAIMPQMRTSDL